MLRSALFLGFLLLLPISNSRAGVDALTYVEQNLQLNGKTYLVRVPKNYRLEFVLPLQAPRLLTFAANGDLFIGSRSGKVYRLPPPYTRATVLVELDNYPHSVAFRRNEILIAQTDGVYRAPYRPSQSEIDPANVSLLAELPGGRGHNSRTVRIGPDGRVYASLGIRGNCSDEYLGAPYAFTDQRGGVLVLREEKGKASWEPFASGLRNPVGFDWQPGTGVMFASNNGPDHLGFEQPPEYFSRLTPGSFHGMPWFQFDGRQIQRDTCVNSAPPRPLQQVHAPEATFPARNAPMAVAFVPQQVTDKRLQGDAVVALRGSWGTPPGGGAASRRHPKLVLVRFDQESARRVDDLVSGFQLPDGQRWARPVGVAFGPDGALYFSSDSDTEGLFRLRRE